MSSWTESLPEEWVIRTPPKSLGTRPFWSLLQAEPSGRLARVACLGCARLGPMGKDAVTRRSAASPNPKPGSRMEASVMSVQATFFGGFGTTLSLTCHLRTVCLGRPYQEHQDPDNIAPRILQVLSLSQVATQRELSLDLRMKDNISEEMHIVPATKRLACSRL